MRAKSTRGTIRFIESPLGENTIRKIIPRLNDMLPEDLKLKHATAHCGRHTSASIAVNSGVDPTTVSKVTKHKDPKTLKSYIHQDVSQRLVTASVIGKRVINDISSPVENVELEEFGDNYEEDKIEEIVDLEEDDLVRKLRKSDSTNSTAKPSKQSTSTSVVPPPPPVINFNYYMK
jgi:hypothetical protein